MTIGAYIKSYRGVWGAVFALAVIVAASLKFSEIVPPWPDEAGFGSSAFAVLSCVIGIILGYYVDFSAKEKQRLFGLYLVAISFVFLIIYAWAYSSLVIVFSQVVDGVEVPRRTVVGLIVSNPAEINVSSRILLQRYGLEGSAWTEGSMTLARLILLFTYMSIFLALTLGLGVLQRINADTKVGRK